MSLILPLAPEFASFGVRGRDHRPGGLRDPDGASLTGPVRAAFRGRLTHVLLLPKTGASATTQAPNPRLQKWLR